MNQISRGGMKSPSFEHLCFSDQPVQALLDVSADRINSHQEILHNVLVPNNKLSMSDCFTTPRIYDSDVSRPFPNSSPPHSDSPGFSQNGIYSYDNRRFEYKRPLNSPSASPPPRKRRQLDRYSPQDVDYKDFFRARNGSFVDRYTPALSASFQHSESHSSKSQNRTDPSSESLAHRTRNGSIAENEVPVNTNSKLPIVARNSYAGNGSREAEINPMLGICPTEIGVHANGSTSDSLRESFDFSKVPKGPKGSSKGPFKKPSVPTFIGPLVSDDVKAGPHIFISSDDVPTLHTTVTHLFRRLRKYDLKDIIMDNTGYYIIFDRSQSGVEQASRCYRECNLQRLFSYTMAMSWSRGQPLPNSVSEPYPNEYRSPIPPKLTESGDMSSTSSAELIRKEIHKGQSVNALARPKGHRKVECRQSATPLESFRKISAKNTSTGSPVVPSQHSPLNVTSVGNSQSSPPVSFTSEKAIQSLNSAHPRSDIVISTHLQPRIREDDEASFSSPLTPSDTSSAYSKIRDSHCHLCKNTHAPEYNPLMGCSSCRRRFHQACQKPPSSPGSAESSWRCYHCLKRERIRSKPSKTPKSPQMPNKPHPSSMRDLDVVTSSKLILDAGQGQDFQSEGQLTEVPSFLEAPSSAAVAGSNCNIGTSEVVAAPSQLLTQNRSKVCEDWRTVSHSSQTSPSSTLQPKQSAASPIRFDAEGRSIFNQAETELTDGSMILESSRTDSTDEVVAATSTASTGVEPPEIPDTPTRDSQCGAPHSSDQSSPLSLQYNLNSGRTLLPHEERQRNIQATGSSQLSDKLLGKRTIHPLVCCVACGKKLLKPPSKGDKPTCVTCKAKLKSNGEQDDSMLSIPETPETAPISDKDGDVDASLRAKAVNLETIRQTSSEKTELKPWLQGLLCFSKPKIVSKTTKNVKPLVPKSIGSSILPAQPAESLPKPYSSPGEGIDESLALSQIDGSPPAVTPSMSLPSRLESSMPRSVSIKSTDGFNTEIAPANNKISASELRTEDKDETIAQADTRIIARHNDSTTLEDRPQTGEQRSSLGGSPVTPSKKPPPSYSYRNLIGMALLAAENNRLTAAQIHQWVSGTFPCYIRGVGKWEGGIGAVLSQHKTFIKLPRGPSDDPKQGCYWTFAKDAKRGYENDPTLSYMYPTLLPVQNTSAHKVRSIGNIFGRKDQNLKQIAEYPTGSATTSDTDRPAAMRRQWEQTTRGVYRLVKCQTTFETHSEHPKARTVCLRNGSYSIGDDVKYAHPQSPGKEALGRIKHIQLLPGGRCVLSLSRYVDKDEARALGCRNIREWPRQIKHIRRADPIAEEVADDAIKDHLSTKELNGISSTLHLSFQDGKCKIRVNPKTLRTSTPSTIRQGVDWVDTCTDEESVEDIQTGYSRERLRQRVNNSIQGHRECSEGLDKLLEGTALNEISHILGGQQSVSGEGSGGVRILSIPHDQLQEDQTMERDLFTAFPDYAIDNVFWDKQKKIEEIKKRPSRKATFGKRLAFARTHRLNPHVELDGPRKPRVTPRRVCSFDTTLENWTTSPTKPVVHGNFENSQVLEILETVSTTQQFSSLEELLELPENPIPITYENQLAFREGVLVNGRLPRPKVMYKVGRNVAGQLK